MAVIACTRVYRFRQIALTPSSSRSSIDVARAPAAAPRIDRSTVWLNDAGLRRRAMSQMRRVAKAIPQAPAKHLSQMRHHSTLSRRSQPATMSGRRRPRKTGRRLSSRPGRLQLGAGPTGAGWAHVGGGCIRRLGQDLPRICWRDGALRAPTDERTYKFGPSPSATATGVTLLCATSRRSDRRARLVNRPPSSGIEPEG
jgi:hypothetical protein